MKAPAPRRSEVWLARLDKVRPLVVLTRDPMGRFLHSVIAVPITSTVREVSTEVAVGPEDGVRLPSVANLDGVQLVEKALLVRRVGRIRSSTMDAICAALVAAVGCERA